MDRWVRRCNCRCRAHTWSTSSLPPVPAVTTRQCTAIAGRRRAVRMRRPAVACPTVKARSHRPHTDGRTWDADLQRRTDARRGGSYSGRGSSSRGRCERAARRYRRAGASAYARESATPAIASR
jgi:hypothetical protein